MEYLGHLHTKDYLFEYLRWEIFPQLGSDCRNGVRVFRTIGSNDVFLYEDRLTNARVIGKFFFSPQMGDWDGAWRKLDREYSNLLYFRSILSDPHYVARPLGRNDDLNRLLVEEYCSGEPLDSVIMRSITGNDPGVLYGKLTALAYFLARMHNNSVQGCRVDFEQNCHYTDHLLRRLEGILSHNEKNELEYLKHLWHDEPAMWEDQAVLVHGDATPSNFFFGDGQYVISFDLERVRATDRVFDVGRLAAELQHFFLRSTGNKYAAEPFIGHFLWEYCCHFPDRERTFEAISKRVPFYMGTTLLRIARNTYLDWNYRRQLIHEAKLCLRRQG